MPELESFTPVDYLIIGHISEDITPQGKVPGGTVSYSALTAKANGLKVGIVTSCRSDLNLDLFAGIEILSVDYVKSAIAPENFRNNYSIRCLVIL